MSTYSPNPYTPHTHKYPLNDDLIIIESFHTAISNISYITTYPERILDSYRPSTSTYRQKRVMGRLLGRVCNDHQSGHPPTPTKHLPTFRYLLLCYWQVCNVYSCEKQRPKRGEGNVRKRVKYEGRFDHSNTLLAFSGSEFNSFTPPFASYAWSTIELIGSSVELVCDSKIGWFQPTANSP